MKKKMISVVTVTGLIFLVLAVGVITMLVKRYVPSRERRWMEIHILE